MNIKEIRELEDEVRETELSRDDRELEMGDSGSWEERDFEVEEDERAEEDEERKEFSIGDTMLARGEAREVWGAKGLEEELELEEFDSVFDDDVFDDEIESSGFSYEAVSRGGDLYGAPSVGGDLYGTSNAGGDLYGGSNAGGSLYGAGNDSVSLYNSSGSSSGGEGSLYNVPGAGKKDNMSVVYKVEGPKKKGAKRRGKRSGLESGIGGVKRRRSKGLSMI